MKFDIEQHEFDVLRDYIERQCGIVLGDNKKYLVETRLTKLVVESGSTSFAEFTRKLIGTPNASLRDKLVDAITTNETLWFRDGAPWITFRDIVLPAIGKRIRQRPDTKFRIWSAACSTGQEPYSVAMLIDAFCRLGVGTKLKPENFEIVATDISPTALFIASSGRYDSISMNRGFTGEWESFRRQYFKETGRVSVISDQIKKLVKYQRFNLQDSFSTLGKFDIVLLRNVAIYFSNKFKTELFQRIARTMNPEGYLLVGSSETVLGYTDVFVTESSHRTTLFRNKS